MQNQLLNQCKIIKTSRYQDFLPTSLNGMCRINTQVICNVSLDQEMASLDQPLERQWRLTTPVS